ncbi:hypothetical protein DAPPUDRAFT_249137 [Daphnia pulex]|uniref:Uncharacterized protein n=1 Tax=Daphnia pulex TaxID=6669 RepID=E9GVY2_DAPPU|nr:hypothetical protein DAPPUDRAFT_249137 [Daphnia pulex]|eukprot:EFX76367.1 hypothetical protein DAPPUDRAFT_249137 [Daphnia pulex]
MDEERTSLQLLFRWIGRKRGLKTSHLLCLWFDECRSLQPFNRMTGEIARASRLDLILNAVPNRYEVN